jgi:N-acetylneuraminic acid mutarotase
MKRRRWVLFAPLVLTLLATGMSALTCGGEQTTSTTAAVTTTALASATTTSQVVTSTTAAPTTTTEPEAVKLERYRVEMTALWEEFDPKMNAVTSDLEGIDYLNLTAAQTETIAEFSKVWRDMVSSLEKIEAPPSLATTHATYVDGLKKMSAAFDQVLEAQKTKDANRILKTGAAFLSVMAKESEAVGTAEEALRSALAFHLSPDRPRAANTWAEVGPSALPPPARVYGSLVYDPVQQAHLLFGGELAGGAYSNDTWAYDPAIDTWTRLEPNGPAPSARSDTSRAYDPTSGKIILFGGDWSDVDTQDYMFYNDAWAYDPAANKWTELKPAGASPSGRSATPMVYDPVGKNMILFGGGIYDPNKEQSTSYKDSWAYDPVDNRWTLLKPSGAVPAKRWSHAMAYDPVGKKIILFGGELEPKKGEYVFYNDTWAYDPAANKWTEMKPAGAVPSARSGCSMVYDPVGKKMILFGGGQEEVNVNDTWAYDPASNAWTDLKPAGDSPSARNGSAAAYDPVYRALILFAGMDRDYVFDDTWAFFPGE